MRSFWPDATDLPTDLGLPPLDPDVEALRAHFRDGPAAPAPMRNPHHEAPVDAARRAAATPAAVLIPILHGAGPPELLLTRRHAEISFGGHICFPGGRADPSDRDPLATALRESDEEIALRPERVEVLGPLGEYVTQSGFRITPIVGLVERPVSLQPNAREVDEILTVPLRHALSEGSYRLIQTPQTAPRAHYVLAEGASYVTGPTVSLVIGLYEALARSGL